SLSGKSFASLSKVSYALRYLPSAKSRSARSNIPFSELAPRTSNVTAVTAPTQAASPSPIPHLIARDTFRRGGASSRTGAGGAGSEAAGVACAGPSTPRRTGGGAQAPAGISAGPEDAAGIDGANGGVGFTVSADDLRTTLVVGELGFLGSGSTFLGTDFGSGR